jgi:hypothetical protein
MFHPQYTRAMENYQARLGDVGNEAKLGLSEAQANEANARADALRNPPQKAPATDKRVDSYVAEDGRHIEVLQRPDGSLYEQPLSKTQGKPEKGLNISALKPEIVAQIGPPPKPETYPQQEKDPKYISDSAAWGKKYQTILDQEAAASGEGRGRGYGLGRFYQMLDTKNGNAPVLVSGDEVQSNPGRYIPSGEGSKALNKTALLEDIRGNVKNVTDDFDAMVKEGAGFDAGARAQLAVALADPQSTAGQYIQSFARNLTPSQQQYVIDLFQLRENAMAMRSVLGAGQGSEDLRRAIIQTLPGAGTPSVEFGKKQLARFQQVLDRLERGVPNVPLRTDIGGGPSGAAATPNAIPTFGEWKAKKQ